MDLCRIGGAGGPVLRSTKKTQMPAAKLLGCREINSRKTGGGSDTANQLSPVPSIACSWLTAGIAIEFLLQAYPSPFSATLRVEFHNVRFLGE
jgi:hypothetical protein